MKTRIVALTLGILFAAGTAFANGPLLGIWKLDEAHSKIAAGMGKNDKVEYNDLLFGRIEVETWGVDAAGTKTHTDWKGKFDGHDYAVKGDAMSDTRAYTKVDDRTVTMVSKKAGKVVSTGKVQVSPDGKSRTVTLNGRRPNGKKYKTVAIYQKTRD